MKSILIGLLIVATILVGGALFAISFPYYHYNQIVNLNAKSSWYYLGRYQKEFVTGHSAREENYEELKNPESWQKFHFGDLLIPLPDPSKNPYYTVVPNFSFSEKSGHTQFSLGITNVNGKVYNKIVPLPYGPFPDYLTDQKLFDLPIVRNAILEKDSDKVWKDLFTKDISAWDIQLKEMFYNLYLLNFRSRFILPQSTDFYLIKDSLKAVMKVRSEDNDFDAEIVFEKRGSRLFTYMLQTRRNDNGATRVRNYLLNKIEFLESTPSLTDIIFREFKNLSYERQVAATGMIYLLSAWSHNPERVEVLKNAIYHLEKGGRAQWLKNRGSSNAERDYRAPNLIQLEPLYVFYFERYKQFYSVIDVPNLQLESNLMLQKNVEKANREAMKKELLEAQKTPEPPIRELSVEDEFKQLIQKTKKSSKTEKGKLRFD